MRRSGFLFHGDKGSRLLLGDLAPRVAEGDRAVKDGLLGRRILIEREVADSFELETIFEMSVREGRFELRAFDNLQRFRIEIILVIARIVRIIGIFDAEETIVESDFRVERRRGVDPVNRSLHATTVRALTAARFRIVLAVDFDDVPVGVLQLNSWKDGASTIGMNWRARYGVDFVWLPNSPVKLSAIRTCFSIERS